MKEHNQVVFFEDTDSEENIKDFFHDITKKEVKVDSLYENNSSKLIDQIKSLSFLSLNENQVSQITELLNKEKVFEEEFYNSVFKLKVTALLSLIDYLIRNQSKYPHTFEFEKRYQFESKHLYIAHFNGAFSDELNDIQNVCGVNIISFYKEFINSNKSNEKFKIIDFSKSFNSNMSTIKKYFLADMTEEEFDEYLKAYIKNKKYILTHS